MKQLFTILLFFFYFSHLAMADGGTTCATATAAVTGTNHSANGDQWFKYTATINGTIVVTNWGKTSFSTSLSIYSDCGTIYAYGKDCGNNNWQKYASFKGVAGTTYYVRWWSDPGFDWTLTERASVAGDDCATAKTAVKGVNQCDHNGYADNWFKFVPTVDELLSVSSCGYTDKETAFTIYSGSDCSKLSNSNSSESCGSIYPFQSKKTVKVTAGSTYWIKWGSQGQNNAYDWALNEIPLPKGAICNNPISAVEGINYVNHYEKSVDQWFLYTLNTSGKVTIITPNKNSYYGPLFFVFLNNCNGKEVASGNDSVSFYGTAGTSFYISFPKTYYQDNTQLSLSFTPQTPPLGTTVENPITAAQGINYTANYKGKQWFTYTAPDNGKLNILNTSGTNYLSGITVYDNNGTFIEDRNNNDSYELNVRKDKKYLFLITVNGNGINPWSLNFRPFSKGTDIKAFYFDGITLDSAINHTNHTVRVTVGKTQDITQLTARFALSDHARAYIGSDLQDSQYGTSKDFTNPVTYKVCNEDTSICTNWTVTVTKASNLSSRKKFLYFKLYGEISPAQIDSVNHQIKDTVAFNTDLTTIYAKFTTSPYSSVYIGTTLQVSNQANNNFSAPVTYTVIAEDGSTQNWVVTAIKQATPKGATADNPTPVVIGINNHSISTQYYSYTSAQDGMFKISLSNNGSSYFYVYKDNINNQIAYTNTPYGGTILMPVEAGATYIFKWQGLGSGTNTWNLELYGKQLGNKILNYGIYNQYGLTQIDTIHHTVNIQVQPGYDLSNLGLYYTLSPLAKASLADSAQLNANGYLNFTQPVIYKIVAQNGNVQNWTVTVTHRDLLTGNDFEGFSLVEQSGNAVIDKVNHTVKLGVIEGTDFTRLVPSFFSSPNDTVKIGTAIQVSGMNMVNFTNPVTYTIKSESGALQNWTVTLFVGTAKNINTDITSFRFNEQKGTAVIDAVNRTISVEVKVTDLTNLVPIFYLSTGATAKIGSTTQVSGTTANNFTQPVIYAVTAEDGTTVNNWTVTVTAGKNNQTDFITFSVPDQIGSMIFDGTNRTITIKVPSDKVVTSVVPTFTLSGGATAKVGTTAQVSGTTANDFTHPVIYAVTAEDGTTVSNWTVTVAANTYNIAAFITFTVPDQFGSTIFDGINHTIAIKVPLDKDVTNLATIFTLPNGATAKVGSTTQVSGTTANNFTNPVVYTVTAQDGITVNNWTVTVIPGKNTETDFITFSVPNQVGTAILDGTNRTITVKVPSNTDVTNVIPTFTLASGATAKVSNTEQVSGATANNFTDTVIYIVTAQDGITVKNWKVNLTKTTSVTDARADNEVTVFPNPSKGLFNIKINTTLATQTRLEVFNSAGTKIIDKSVETLGEQLVPLDLSGYPAGIYYLKVLNGEKITNLKLVVN